MPCRNAGLAVCVTVLASGCLFHATRPAPGPVDSTVHVELAETIPSALGTLRLLLRTERRYGCSNMQLVTSLRTSPDALQLGIAGVRAPGVCLTSLAPASAQVDLGHLETGEYALRFLLNGAMIDSRLLVTADTYRIVGGNAASFAIDHSALRRVPAHMVWGWIGYSSAADQAAASEYLHDLRALGAAPHLFPSGRYAPVVAPGADEEFRIDDRGRLSFGGNMGFLHLEPYVFRYDGGAGALRALVSATGEPHRGAVFVPLETGAGDRFMSWAPAASAAARRRGGRG